MATFEVSDAFEVPVSFWPNKARYVDFDALKSCEDIEQPFCDFLTLKGVYVFSMRTGGGTLPWYVGKSEKSTFLREAFNHRNRNALNELLNSMRGTLLINFITQSTFRGKPNLSNIGEIENLLIGHASERNSNLLNVQGRLKKPNFTIKNLYNSGKGKKSEHERRFGELMGL